MDFTVLIAGLVGAIIGSMTSIGTLIIQNYFQNRRESKRLIFETAYKDYELRFLHTTEGTPQRAAFPIILAYHQKMIELLETGRLTPTTAKEILEAQVEMGRALQGAINDIENQEKQ